MEAKNKDDSPPLQSRGRVAKKDSVGMREEKRTPSFSEKRTRLVRCVCVCVGDWDERSESERLTQGREKKT